MTSKRPFTKVLPLVAVAAAAGALVGCSTMKSISPFSSNVPYAQDIQPTLPKPAVSEIPAFKPKLKPEVSVSEKPVPASPTEAPPPPAPAVASPAPAPAASEAPPPPSAPQKQSSAAPETATRTAEAEAPGSKAKAGESSEDTEVAGEGEKKPQPTIPEADKAFHDDGTYPNLAQVPARPVNMPTFTEAKALEKALVADAGKAKADTPASPEAPSVDSSPVPVSKLVTTTAPAITAAADRPEDSSPCLSGRVSETKATATVSFEAGSAAIDTGRLQALVEAMPSIRAATGTIRIFGHGDPGADGAAGSGRFDLAVARANAVAQAVAGYGIPAPRIAVGVACSDAALGGSSVQLYAES